MDKIKNSKFVRNLKRQAEENPLLAIGLTAATLTAVSKLLEANTQRTYAKAHAREVERREYQTYSRRTK